MGSKPVDVTAVEFEPEYMAGLIDIYERLIVFNTVLGLKVAQVGPERVSATLEMRPELIGHYAHQRVHGGVISACLDVIGSLAVMAANGARHMHEPVEQRLARFNKLGTIDLRVDYLRPGVGDRFTVSAEVMRLGSRVGSTRMEFRGPQDKLMATGAGAYIVS
jgi:uncharacterized protein (TIGR00369 family)